MLIYSSAYHIFLQQPGYSTDAMANGTLGHDRRACTTSCEMLKKIWIGVSCILKNDGSFSCTVQTFGVQLPNFYKQICFYILYAIANGTKKIWDLCFSFNMAGYTCKAVYHHPATSISLILQNTTFWHTFVINEYMKRWKAINTPHLHTSSILYGYTYHHYRAQSENSWQKPESPDHESWERRTGYLQGKQGHDGS